MAEFFGQRGIPAVAITSNSPDRDELVRQFRGNQFNVAFTVDLFNEGIDFPNVRVLMFLRPTESKTVFLQQLGRGLRLCSGKDRVRVLDFIGNYRKANYVRKYLARRTETSEATVKQRTVKPVYVYAPGCEVHFAAEVEEILNRQDQEERGITKDGLIQAYYEAAERLKRKPTQGDLNREGPYKVPQYQRLFGSWLNFLREIGEYTEANYHYPPSIHLGHVLYTLQVLASGRRDGTLLEDRYVRLRGGLDSGRMGRLQRQTKYKLQTMMELGLVPDDREFGPGQTYPLELTAQGKRLYQALVPVINAVDLSFSSEADDNDLEEPENGNGAPVSDEVMLTWRMTVRPEEFNRAIWDYLQPNPVAKETVRQAFLSMPAASQMLNYLYRAERRLTVPKADIYRRFFALPEVKEYCDQHGVEIATESARRRCPFLLNILESLGLLKQDRSTVTLQTFLAASVTLRMSPRESDHEVVERLQRLVTAWPDRAVGIPDEELSRLREAFGPDFLTQDYFLSPLETMN
jgi:hypothetical protein